jgi:hypothetical protein
MRSCRDADSLTSLALRILLPAFVAMEWIAARIGIRSLAARIREEGLPLVLEKIGKSLLTHTALFSLVSLDVKYYVNMELFYR